MMDAKVSFVVAEAVLLAEGTERQLNQPPQVMRAAYARFRGELRARTVSLDTFRSTTTLNRACSASSDPWCLRRLLMVHVG